MPPKGKPQLNERQVNLLHWWIANGNSFDKKVNEIEQPDKIKTVLISLQSKPGDSEIPHFVTFTVVGWIDVFSKEIYKILIVKKFFID